MTGAPTFSISQTLEQDVGRDRAEHGFTMLVYSIPTCCHPTIMPASEVVLTVTMISPGGSRTPPRQAGIGGPGRLLNNLVVMIVASLIQPGNGFRTQIAEGIDYPFGRNGLGQSYVCGYGIDYSRHLRTRQFGHDLDSAMPPPPTGALAGGANSRPSPDFPYDPRLRGRPPQLCYLDEPSSEVTNDLCIRWQPPLVYLAAYLDPAGRQATPTPNRQE